MKAKKLITGFLLGFIVTSVAVMVVKNVTEGSGLCDGSCGGVCGMVADGQLTDGAVVVYYFHGQKRCMKCNTIEAYAKEAVETAFAEELASGKLLWRVVNFEQGVNTHFADDFGLAYGTVVVERIDGAGRGEFEMLDDVWSLVGDKAGFAEYIKKNVGEYLSGAGQ